MDGDMMINKRTGKVLGPEVDYVCYRKFSGLIFKSLKIIKWHAVWGKCFMF